MLQQKFVCKTMKKVSHKTFVYVFRFVLIWKCTMGAFTVSLDFSIFQLLLSRKDWFVTFEGNTQSFGNTILEL